MKDKQLKRIAEKIAKLEKSGRYNENEITALIRGLSSEEILKVDEYIMEHNLLKKNF